MDGILARSFRLRIFDKACHEFFSSIRALRSFHRIEQGKNAVMGHQIFEDPSGNLKSKIIRRFVCFVNNERSHNILPDIMLLGLKSDLFIYKMVMFFL